MKSLLWALSGPRVAVGLLGALTQGGLQAAVAFLAVRRGIWAVARILGVMGGPSGRTEARVRSCSVAARKGDGIWQSNPIHERIWPTVDSS